MKKKPAVKLATEKTAASKLATTNLATSKSAAPPPAWTFLTNHAHVLWCIYREPEIRLRDVAERVGITERMVQKIVAELARAHYLRVEKQGRRNVYQLTVERPLRHSLEAHCTVSQLLELLSRTERR